MASIILHLLIWLLLQAPLVTWSVIIKVIKITSLACFIIERQVLFKLLVCHFFSSL